MNRDPPQRKPALFKVDDRVEVDLHKDGRLPGAVVSVQPVDDEDLVRYAYCFFWTYVIRFADGTEGQFSENVLHLRLIEQLGSLVDDDA